MITLEDTTSAHVDMCAARMKYLRGVINNPDNDSEAKLYAERRLGKWRTQWQRGLAAKYDNELAKLH